MFFYMKAKNNLTEVERLGLPEAERGGGRVRKRYRNTVR
jgi:hypothetical protein